MDRRLKAADNATSAFVTAFRRVEETRFVGHALWRDAPYLQFVIEIMVDGEPIGLVRAEQHSPELAAAEPSAGDHGFAYIARKQLLDGHHQIEARIANLAVPLGTPIDLKLQPFDRKSGDDPGRVDWLGGLRLAGSVSCKSGKGMAVTVYENGALLAETTARRWHPPSVARADLGAAHFDLHLPPSLADGRVHQLAVRDEAGTELVGSPVQILALADPLRSLINGDKQLVPESVKAEWFDRYLPMSVPFSEYDAWKRRFVSAPLKLATEPPVRIVVIGTEKADKALETLSHQKYANWSATVVPTAGDSSFNWDDLQKAVTTDAAEDTIALFLRPSTVLREDAVTRLVQALVEHDGAAAYGDIETALPDGSHRPLFFGAFDYERMLEQGYAATVFAMRANRLKVPANESSGNLCRLLLALCDADGAQAAHAIVHTPGILATVDTDIPLPPQTEIEAATSAHLRTRKVKALFGKANGASLPAIHVKRRTSPDTVISVVIPTRDRIDLLAPCIDSIAKTTRKNIEIVVVDNGSSAPETLSFLKTLQRKGRRVIDAPGPFNYSHLNNVGVNAAKGDVICLLNNDTEIVDPDWLDEMLSRLIDPTVGAVAPKLVWPNRMVQHGGIVLGPNFAASDAFNDCFDLDPGYGDLLRVAHESTALSAACMLVRRTDYLAVKGFDEIAFPVLFNDVDFCLKLRASGKRNVFTPHTSLVHHEAASRRYDDTYSKKSRFHRELKNLRARWANVLANDPLYSPYLNLDPYPFSALAWPPRPNNPRINTVAIAKSPLT